MITIHRDRVCAKWNGEEIRLTRQEFMLFAALFEAPDMERGKISLLKELSPEAEPKLVDVVVCRVRKAIAPFGLKIIRVRTGYIKLLLP